MPFNGSGTFNPKTPEYPAVANTLIEAADWNAIISDIATGLTNAVTRDGQSPLLANLNAGGFKLTNLANGVSSADSLALGQVLSGTDALKAGMTAVTQTTGDNTTKVATTAFVQNTAMSTALPNQSGNSGKTVITDGTTASWSNLLPGLRNKIINGKMEVAQRGTSFPAANGYTVDRFGFLKSGATVATVTQQADAPNNTDFQSSLRANITTNDAAIASGDFAIFYQTIEGYNIRDLAAKTFTCSFWVRSPKTGIHCISFRNGSATDRSYVIEYTVNAVDTWEYKTVAVTNGLPSAGTWNYTNGHGLTISWAMASGTEYHTTAGAWQTGNFLSTSSQVNCVDTIGNLFAITGVQLEAGPVATAYEHRPVGLEVHLCFRYYEVGYLKAYIPGATTPIAIAQNYRAYKRTVPTVTYAAPPAGSQTNPTSLEWNAVAGFSAINNATTFLEFEWRSDAEL